MIVIACDKCDNVQTVQYVFDIESYFCYRIKGAEGWGKIDKLDLCKKCLKKYNKKMYIKSKELLK